MPSFLYFQCVCGDFIAGLKSTSGDTRKGVIKNSTIRERAVKALGSKNDDRVIEPLIAALKDKSSNVTKAAIDALGERKDPRAVMPLVDFLKRSKPHHKRYVINVRASAFQALGKMDDLLIVDPMMELLKEKDLNLRTGVEKRLENIKDPRAADVLINN